MIKLYSYSVQNKDDGHSDTNTILNGNSTGMDNIVEYSARVCYKSTDRMGDSVNFIPKLVGKGHEDVVEHGYVTFAFTHDPYDSYRSLNWWYGYNRYINVSIAYDENNNAISLVGGNLRTWLQLARRLADVSIYDGFDYESIAEILPYLIYLAPNVFSEFEGYKQPVTVDVFEPASVVTHKSDQSQATVTLLSSTQGHRYEEGDTFLHATFLIEGVSRALSHQLVRYRLLSFSQESQRYVDLEKGDWGIVVPQSIADAHVTSHEEYYENFMDHGTRAIMYGGAEYMGNSWDVMKQWYRDLRDAGVRKEDARMLLPNATETRLVVSGTLEGWRNAIWQRCAKSAQWEIRGVFMEILKILYQLYPNYFQDEYYTFIGEGNDQIPS